MYQRFKWKIFKWDLHPKPKIDSIKSFLALGSEICQVLKVLVRFQPYEAFLAWFKKNFLMKQKGERMQVKFPQNNWN